MKIAFFEVTSQERNFLKKIRFPGHSVALFAGELTAESAAQAKPFDVVSVFIYSALTAPVLKSLPKLKLISTRSTGFDHIDLSAASKRGISVSNVPSYGENTVAEHTFALILSLSRNVHKAYVRTLSGDFRLEGLQGFDLKGKTIGVVGAGHIGLHVIRMAKGFGMQVKAFDTQRNSFLSEVLDFDYVPLDELLRTSDIISLHAPYNRHTHHIINRDNITSVKRGAILINTARGGLVETHALLEALENGTLAGAGLDVIEGEELIKEEKQLLSHHYSLEKMETLLKSNILLHRDNVVFTPHIGFNSAEALQRILDTTVENIRQYLSGTPQNTVARKK